MSHLVRPFPTNTEAGKVYPVGAVLMIVALAVPYAISVLATLDMLICVGYFLLLLLAGVLSTIVCQLSHKWAVVFLGTISILTYIAHIWGVTIHFLGYLIPWILLFISLLKSVSNRLFIRYALMAVTAVCAVYTFALFFIIVQGIKISSLPLTLLRPSLLLLCMHLVVLGFTSWAFARLTASNDPWFFSNVLQADSLDDPAPIVHDPSKLVKNKECVYLLEALIRPSRVISRITDRVEPVAGSCAIHSEVEFEIPISLSNRSGGHLYLPVLFQGKCELSRDLKVCMSDGSPVRRLSDNELVDRVVEGFIELFIANTWRFRSSDAIRELVEYAFKYHPGETEAQFKRNCEQLSRACNIVNEEQAVLVASFLMAVRHVKPICYTVIPPSVSSVTAGAACGDVLKRGARSGSCSVHHLTLIVDRNTPLVPVREQPNTPADICRVYLRRLLSKRRSHYYYGLGNADCAQSYHLSFGGSKETFFSEVQLVNIGGPEEFFICESMTINARFDQDRSRLYIRKGRGFARAALSFSLEQRSQHLVASLVLCALTCLLMTLYFFFNSKCRPLNLSEAIIPLTVLSVSVFASIWQSMESYRAEEWMWICSGTDIIAALFVSVKLMTGTELDKIMGPVLPAAWNLILMAEMAVLLIAGLVLLFKVKLHGMIMDRVPRFRTIPGLDVTSFYCSDFIDLIDEQIDLLLDQRGSKKYTNVSSNVSSSSPSLVIRFSRDERYCQDIVAYESLMSRRWIDGWLIPVWSAGVNPFRQPSMVYTIYALTLVH